MGEGQLTFSDAFSPLAWAQLGSPVTGDLTMAAGTSRALYGTPAASSGLHLPSPQSAPTHAHGSSPLQWQTPELQRQAEQAAGASAAAGGWAGPRDRSYLAATVLFLKQRNRLLSSQRENAERDRSSALNCVHMLQQENAELKER